VLKTPGTCDARPLLKVFPETDGHHHASRPMSTVRLLQHDQFAGSHESDNVDDVNSAFHRETLAGFCRAMSGARAVGAIAFIDIK